MVDATGSSVSGRGLGVLGRGGVPAAMVEPSVPVRRREADGLVTAAATAPGAGRERPSAARPRIRTREDVASII